MSRLVVLLVAAAALSGCAARGHAVRPPGAEAASPGLSALSVARSLVGTPYRDGGTSAAGFDCSGFVWYVFREIGVTSPRSVREQFVAGRPVERDRLRAGDLVFFAIDGRTVSHVGIAAGSGTFVHAPSWRGQVREESLSLPYWDSRYRGARRMAGG